jgi:hypothetical protein
MGAISLSRKERLRMELMSPVRDGSMSLSAASAALGMNYREARRVKARYAVAGDAGLVHKLRGRASNNQTAAAGRGAM